MAGTPQDQTPEGKGPEKYKFAPNGVSPPFQGKRPPVDIREVMPHDADKVISPPPIPANGFKPGAAAQYEYVSGHKGIFFSQYIKALGPYVDDLTQDLGDDIYERMLNDSQVDSCMRVLKVGILSEEGKIKSPITDEKHPKYERAQKIADFIEHCVKQLPLPLSCTLEEMLDGVALGHKAAESIYEVRDYSEAGSNGEEFPPRKRWVWESIRTKPRGSTAFLVDAYMRVLGVLAQVPGLPYPIVSGQLVSDPSTIPNLLPRKKFMIFSHNPKDMDPRGRSGLRSSYTPWWIKQQTISEMLKYLATYAIPSLYGITAADTTEKPEYDKYGNVTGRMITPEQDLANTLALLRNNSTIGLPAGTEVGVIPASGGSGGSQMVFLQTIDWCNKEMAKAILAQTLATEEGEHMARAASDNHMAILELGLRLLKMRLAACVKNDLFRPLVEFNFGEDDARELCPDYILTDLNRSDWAMWSQVAVTMFETGYITIEQKEWIDSKLGLPKTTLTKDEQQLPGNLPANYLVKKILGELEMQMQSEQAATQQQMEAQQPQPQGQAPTGMQSPSHPTSQQPPEAKVPQPQQAA